MFWHILFYIESVCDFFSTYIYYILPGDLAIVVGYCCVIWSATVHSPARGIVAIDCHALEQARKPFLAAMMLKKWGRD